MGVLLILTFQSASSLIPETPLSGARFAPKVQDASINAWMDGDIQTILEQQAEHSFGFRPGLIRLVNQIRFSLFDDYSEQVVRGKGGQLFESGYRDCVCGRDFLGEERITELLDSLDYFQNKLLKNGTPVIILIAPNKWRTYHEKIDWGCKGPKQTNYKRMIERLRRRGYAVYDGIDVFLYEKSLQPQYPLHPKQGTHWSIFGAALAADHLAMTFAEAGINLPKIVWDSIEVSDQPRNTDKDLHDLLNIMLGPKSDSLAYPVLHTEGDKKPHVTIIGDSYYWSFYYLGLYDGLFAPESKFFYYNKTLFGIDQTDRSPLTKEDRQYELNASDAVLLVMSEPSLKMFGFGVFDDLDEE